MATEMLTFAMYGTTCNMQLDKNYLTDSMAHTNQWKAEVLGSCN